VVPEVIPEVQPTAAPAAKPGRLFFSAGASLRAMEARKAVLLTGRVFLGLGLVSVILGRGCDVVAVRAVERANSRLKLEQLEFDEKWDRQENDLERKLEAIRQKEKPEPNDAAQITSINEQLSKLRKDRSRASEVFRQTTLRDLQFAATQASYKQVLSSYWHAVLYVFGSLLLAIGLIAASPTAEGAERWVCLAAMLVLMFSLYVFGMGWITLPSLSLPK
jgi:cytochrome bd-type quinol oxidase subunit 1